MEQRQELDAPRLRELLEYDPETGGLIWRPRSPTTAGNKSFNAKFAGKRAFTAVDSKGYHCSCLSRKFLLAHRVIWAMVHGEWPEQIDHINGNRLDNRICNLRAATQAENSRNMARTRQNSSGVSGVYWQRKDKRWIASIRTGNGGREYLGYFRNFDDAVAARREAERRYGYHPNHGKRAA